MRSTAMSTILTTASMKRCSLTSSKLDVVVIHFSNQRHTQHALYRALGMSEVFFNSKNRSAGTILVLMNTLCMVAHSIEQKPLFVVS